MPATPNSLTSVVSPTLRTGTRIEFPVRRTGHYVRNGYTCFVFVKTADSTGASDVLEISVQEVTPLEARCLSTVGRNDVLSFTVRDDGRNEGRVENLRVAFAD